MVEGVAEAAEVEEAVILLVEDCEAPLVVEETELCSAEFVELESPDRDDGLEEGEELEVDPDEEAVLVTLPEPLAVVEKLPVDGMPENDTEEEAALEHNASKYPIAAAASVDEQLDTMHEATSLANTSLLQIQWTSVEEQLALCADESEHALTQWGGEGGDWDPTPRTDKAIVKLRQRVSKRTMGQKILVTLITPASNSFKRRLGGDLGEPKES